MKMPFGNRSFLLFVLMFILSVSFCSCARVLVKKIPTPSQYTKWTDDLQAKADKIEGIRFYLPRPFVNVFESFPVHSEVFLANGVVSADGQYVVIREVRSDSPLKDYFAGQLTHVSVPVTLIRKSSVDLQSGKEKSEIDTLRKDVDAIRKQLDGSIATGATPDAPAEHRADEAEQKDTSPEQQPLTGQKSRSVTNDNGAFAYQPMRGNMDIVYLPDFEEQYAIKSMAGLGNATFGVNLGQGWSLQGFNSLTDNSQLNNRIFNLLDVAVEGAKGIISGGASRITNLVSGLASTPGSGVILESGPGEGIEAQPGADVSIKISIVYYAVKGLYPVIKPRELQERMGAEDASNHVAIDIMGTIGKTTVATHLDPKALKRAQDAVESGLGNFTVPRYPYQYISFNTFRLLAVEAVNPTTDPFKYLIHKTGTQGEPGDRQAADFADQIIFVGKSDPPKKSDDKEIVAAKAFVTGVEKWIENGNKVIKFSNVKIKLCTAKVIKKTPWKVRLKVVATGQVDDRHNVKNKISRELQKLITPENIDLEIVSDCTEEYITKTEPEPKAWKDLKPEERKILQRSVCVKQDGLWGLDTSKAIDVYISAIGRSGDIKKLDRALAKNLIAISEKVASRQCKEMPPTDKMVLLAEKLLNTKPFSLATAEISVEKVFAGNASVNATVVVKGNTSSKFELDAFKKELIKGAADLPKDTSTELIVIGNFEKVKSQLGH